MYRLGSAARLVRRARHATTPLRSTNAVRFASESVQPKSTTQLLDDLINESSAEGARPNVSDVPSSINELLTSEGYDVTATETVIRKMSTVLADYGLGFDHWYCILLPYTWVQQLYETLMTTCNLDCLVAIAVTQIMIRALLSRFWLQTDVNTAIQFANNDRSAKKHNFGGSEIASGMTKVMDFLKDLQGSGSLGGSTLSLALIDRSGNTTKYQKLNEQRNKETEKMRNRWKRFVGIDVQRLQEKLQKKYNNDKIQDSMLRYYMYDAIMSKMRGLISTGTTFTTGAAVTGLKTMSIMVPAMAFRSIQNSDVPLETSYNYVNVLHGQGMYDLPLGVCYVDETHALLGVWMCLQAASFRWQFRDSPNDNIRNYHPYAIMAFLPTSYWFFCDRPIMGTTFLLTNCICTVAVKAVGRSDWYRDHMGIIRYDAMLAKVKQMDDEFGARLYSYRGVPAERCPDDIRDHLYPKSIGDRIKSTYEMGGVAEQMGKTWKNANPKENQVTQYSTLHRHVVKSKDYRGLDKDSGKLVSAEDEEKIEEKFDVSRFKFWKYIPMRAQYYWFRHPDQDYALFGLFKVKSTKSLRKSYEEDYIRDKLEDEAKQKEDKALMTLDKERSQMEKEITGGIESDPTDDHLPRNMTAPAYTTEDVMRNRRASDHLVDWQKREQDQTSARPIFGRIGRRDPREYANLRY